MGGTADVVVALGTGESVELDLKGPRLLRPGEFRGRGVQKVEKTWKSRPKSNRKFFDFSKVVKMTKFGCLEYSFDRKVGFFRGKKTNLIPAWAELGQGPQCLAET